MRLRWLLVPILLMSAADVAVGQASSTSWTDLIEKIKPGVVVIETDKGLGSGFFVNSNGTLVTNHHVIAGATAVNVKLANGEVFRKVYLLADSQDRDLAILRVEASNVPTVPLGDSNEVKVGKMCYSLVLLEGWKKPFPMASLAAPDFSNRARK